MYHTIVSYTINIREIVVKSTFYSMDTVEIVLAIASIQGCTCQEWSLIKESDGVLTEMGVVLARIPPPSHIPRDPCP